MKNEKMSEVKDVLKSIAILVLALALAVSVIFNLSYIEEGREKIGSPSLDISGVQHVIRDSDEIITADYPYKDYGKVVVQRQAFGWDMPFGETEVTYSYSGTVKAGVRFSDIKPMSIDEENNVVTLKISDITCFENDVDYSTVAIESGGYFSNVSEDSIEIDKSVMAEKALADEGFIDTVRQKVSSEVNSRFAMNEKTRGYVVNIIWGDEQKSS